MLRKAAPRQGQKIVAPGQPAPERERRCRRHPGSPPKAKPLAVPRSASVLNSHMRRLPALPTGGVCKSYYTFRSEKNETAYPKSRLESGSGTCVRGCRCERTCSTPPSCDRLCPGKDVERAPMRTCMKSKSIRRAAIKIFLPAPATFALIVAVVLSAKIAVFLIEPILVLALWVGITAPSAASFAARNVFFGVAYGLISLLVAACALGLAYTAASESCSFRQCFVPTVVWTVFYCWIIFVFCGVLFSGASARINPSVDRETERKA